MMQKLHAATHLLIPIRITYYIFNKPIDKRPYLIRNAFKSYAPRIYIIDKNKCNHGTKQ